MKIAILLMGFTRNSLNEYDFYYENFFKYLNYDLFIHTWTDDGFKSNQIDISKTTKKIFSKNKTDINKLIKLYKPTLIEVEDISTMKFPDKPKWMTLKTSKYYFKDYYSQAYGIYKCYKLKEKHEQNNNIKYDYCLKLRFDLKEKFNRKNGNLLFNDTITNMITKYNNFNHHDYIFCMEDQYCYYFYNNLLKMINYKDLEDICPFVKDGWKFVIDTWLISLYKKTITPTGI